MPIPLHRRNVARWLALLADPAYDPTRAPDSDTRSRHDKKVVDQEARQICRESKVAILKSRIRNRDRNVAIPCEDEIVDLRGGYASGRSEGRVAAASHVRGALAMLKGHPGLLASTDYTPKETSPDTPAGGMRTQLKRIFANPIYVPSIIKLRLWYTRGIELRLFVEGEESSWFAAAAYAVASARPPFTKPTPGGDVLAIVARNPFAFPGFKLRLFANRNLAFFFCESVSMISGGWQPLCASFSQLIPSLPISLPLCEGRPRPLRYPPPSTRQVS